ncbi:hypothetical protein H0H87_003143, partial [Tephrocybe sp. NHM501043]
LVHRPRRFLHIRYSSYCSPHGGVYYGGGRCCRSQRQRRRYAGSQCHQPRRCMHRSQLCKLLCHFRHCRSYRLHQLANASWCCCTWSIGEQHFFHLSHRGYPVHSIR